MAIGVLFVLFSLPLVTIGAAWCAAAEITASWHHGQEPPLLATFARVVRRDLRPGLVLQATLLATAAITWFEVRVVLASRLPGYPFEATALTLLGAAAAAFALLTAAYRAALPGDPAPWPEAARTTATQVRQRPSTLVLPLTACAFTAVLIALIPAFAAFMAGPLAYAISTVRARNQTEARSATTKSPT